MNFLIYKHGLSHHLVSSLILYSHILQLSVYTSALFLAIIKNTINLYRLILCPDNLLNSFINFGRFSKQIHQNFYIGNHLISKLKTLPFSQCKPFTSLCSCQQGLNRNDNIGQENEIPQLQGEKGIQAFTIKHDARQKFFEDAFFPQSG